MPMANATAIAVRAASPKEIRHATRKPAARFALTPEPARGKPFGVRRRLTRAAHSSR